MPSILPDYEYDIFISYRQNDNKRDGWVTQFVKALQEELEATLKNPVSIYFDENPHDGLLETHQVDATLDNKLKCIVLIPIISQTYCDEKGYAWSKEFLPFLEMAEHDTLGMNIKLKNGNVVSRVLPIRIHDLDNEDQSLLEEKLGGHLRAIDFIYKEPGVNRPLKPQDKRDLNQEKTSYHNQINKVANALKEIGTAVLRQEPISQDAPQPVKSDTSGPVKKKLRPYLIPVLVVLIGIISYTFWYGLKTSSTTDYDYDIAVMYMENLTDDANYADGLVNLIQINLAEDTSLNLVPRQKLYDALKALNDETKAPDQSIATELASAIGTEYMIIGRVIQQASEVMAQVELIEVLTGKVRATKTVKGNKDEIFLLADNITAELMKGRIPERNYDVTALTTSNYTAYQYFYQGLEDMWDLNFSIASNKLSKAIQIDSTFAMAYVYKAIAENPFGDLDIYANPFESRATIDKAMTLVENLPYRDQLLTKMIHQFLNQDEGYNETIAQLIKIDPYDKLIGLFEIDRVMYGATDTAKVEDHVLKVIERNPDATDLYNSLAYFYIHIGEKEKAMQAVDNYRIGDPKLFNGYHSSWEIYLMAGEVGRALEFARYMEQEYDFNNRFTWRGISYLFTLQPDSAIELYLNTYRGTLSQSLLRIGGNAYLMKGQWSKSLAAFDEVIMIAQDSNRQELKSYLSLSKPVVMMVAGRYEEANKLLDEIIVSTENFDYNPYLIVANFYKGLILLKQGNVEKAKAQLAVLESAIVEQGSNKKFEQFSELLAMEVALNKGKYDELGNMLNKTKIIKTRTSPRFFYINLHYLIATGKEKQALAYLNDINTHLLSARSNFGGDQTLFTVNLLFSNFYRGQILEKLGNDSEAIEAYSAFLKLMNSSETDLPQMKMARERISELSTN